jgi:hypothetical protein
MNNRFLVLDYIKGIFWQQHASSVEFLLNRKPKNTSFLNGC